MSNYIQNVMMSIIEYVQCDQIANLFVQIWAFITLKTIYLIAFFNNASFKFCNLINKQNLVTLNI